MLQREHLAPSQANIHSHESQEKSGGSSKPADARASMPALEDTMLPAAPRLSAMANDCGRQCGVANRVQLPPHIIALNIPCISSFAEMRRSESLSQPSMIPSKQSETVQMLLLHPPCQRLPCLRLALTPFLSSTNTCPELRKQNNFSIIT